MAELTALYKAKGLSEEAARTVAAEPTAQDALSAIPTPSWGWTLTTWPR